MTDDEANAATAAEVPLIDFSLYPNGDLRQAACDEMDDEEYETYCSGIADVNEFFSEFFDSNAEFNDSWDPFFGTEHEVMLLLCPGYRKKEEKWYRRRLLYLMRFYEPW